MRSVVEWVGQATVYCAFEGGGGGGRGGGVTSFIFNSFSPCVINSNDLVQRYTLFMVVIFDKSGPRTKKITRARSRSHTRSCRSTRT